RGAPVARRRALPRRFLAQCGRDRHTAAGGARVRAYFRARQAGLGANARAWHQACGIPCVLDSGVAREARDQGGDRPVTIQGIYHVAYATLDELVLAYSEDLSRGGLFVPTGEPAALDAVVRINLELPGDGGMVSVLGQVVHVNAKPRGMGIEFVESDLAWLERIE